MRGERITELTGRSLMTTLYWWIMNVLALWRDGFLGDSAEDSGDAKKVDSCVLERVQNRFGGLRKWYAFYNLVKKTNLEARKGKNIPIDPEQKEPDVWRSGDTFEWKRKRQGDDYRSRHEQDDHHRRQHGRHRYHRRSPSHESRRKYRREQWYFSSGMKMGRMWLCMTTGRSNKHSSPYLLKWIEMSK